MSDLADILEGIRSGFEAEDAARERALQDSRTLIRLSAQTIRGIHREEWESAESMLTDTRQAAHSLIARSQALPKIYYAGYTQDALKEYVEASLLYAFLRRQPVPTPDDLGVEGSTWLNGLSEAATELRRRILDIIRPGHSQEAEQLLGLMDEIYSLLMSLDFHDSITDGLRRRVDTVRGVLERTRGDVTTSLRQAQLEQALSDMEHRLAGAPVTTPTALQ